MSYDDLITSSKVINYVLITFVHYYVIKNNFEYASNHSNAVHLAILHGGVVYKCFFVKSVLAMMHRPDVIFHAF